MCVFLVVSQAGCDEAGGQDDDGVASDDAGEGDGAPGVDAGETGAGPDGAPDPVLPDPCSGEAPACPPRSGVGEGSGLASIDRCAFPMEDRDTWGERGALIDRLAEALEPVSLVDVLGDLNRTAVPIPAGQLPGDVPGVTSAFGWQSGDQSVRYWIPQGITGSGDGVEGGRVNGRRVLLVSWYYDRAEDPGSAFEKGVRLAVVDATDPASIHYRFLLLVEPTMAGDQVSFGPVRIHAGGLAWVGDLLYVVDTSRGLRAFDLTRILKVQTGVDAIGHDAGSGGYYAHNYLYVVPQIGTYAQTSSCTPRYSFVSLDRTTSPPSLVTGEYDAESVYGRLYRWPLDPSSGRLRQVGDAGRVIADEVWFSSHSHVQGALAHDGTFWLSSSKPAGARGILYRAAEGETSADLGWSDTPEDLSYDPTDGLLWSLSEGLSARYVFSLPLGAVD
jgi:hypothetical protein